VKKKRSGLIEIWNLDGAIRLHREVVLITDDRNLRLKAQARNVPVKDLMKFLELAQVVLWKKSFRLNWFLV